MNKKIVLGIIIGAVLAGGVVLVAYTTQASQKVVSDLPQTDATTTPVVHSIQLLQDHADPAQLLIKVGEFVEFDSKDGKSHNIASGKGNDYAEHHDHTMDDGIESGPFAPDEGYKVQFKEIGTFYFHDHMNPNIAISVAVYDPNSK